jgi:hypothetical protein
MLVTGMRPGRSRKPSRHGDSTTELAPHPIELHPQSSNLS